LGPWCNNRTQGNDFQGYGQKLPDKRQEKCLAPIPSEKLLGYVKFKTNAVKNFVAMGNNLTTKQMKAEYKNTPAHIFTSTWTKPAKTCGKTRNKLATMLIYF